MNSEQPTVFDKARDAFIHALAACDRSHLRDAIQRGQEALRVLETEEAFREARKGNT
jgi:hypothetical protein